MGKKKISLNESDTIVVPIVALQYYVSTPVIPHPVKLDNDEQRELMEKASRINSQVFIATSEGDSDKSDKLKELGTVCFIDKVLYMPGAPSLAFLRPCFRARLQDIVYSETATMAKVSPMKNVAAPKRLSAENNSTMERITQILHHTLQFAGEPEKANADKIIEENSANPVSYIYAVSHIAPLTWEERYEILECNTFSELLRKVVELLDLAEQKIEIQAKIHEKTHRELTQQQKEAFLRTHLKHIHEELGDFDDSDDADVLVEKSKEKKWSEEAQKHFDREIYKLRKLNINNPEYSILHSYLETFLDLPWENYSNKKISIDKVEKILDRDHYGLEKVKERILEYMSVIKLRNDLKAPILCLYGPPGVGKTSIGKSVAEATGRDYARIALGGMHDEAEIRGHRRTYIGAMPGRILHTLSKCKSGNPLILLDEIDKVSKDFKGDPSSALLEALDPEQNNTFHDNFIDFPYDLSKVLFIATANDLSTIPAPLRDRMEVIEISGYIPAEKREIALRHLVNKALKDNGFKENEVVFTPEAIDAIIRFYTREAGVRQLEKNIGKIIRKLARMKVSGKELPEAITEPLVYEFLGKKLAMPEAYETNDFAGVATGLAWTPAGGDILFIETSLSPGKGEKITLTGNLGDVMKESAMLALQYLKANADKIGIPQDLFGKYDIHIHVPEGAVPKDGPSAGITIASSMASAFLGKKLKEKTAMTGELTLRGKVLPVGGIKEKIIAARQGGINNIILSEENRRDIEEIPPQYIEGMNFNYVKTFQDVLDKVLLDELAPYNFNLT